MRPVSLSDPDFFNSDCYITSKYKVEWTFIYRVLFIYCYYKMNIDFVIVFRNSMECVKTVLNYVTSFNTV